MINNATMMCTMKLKNLIYEDLIYKHKPSYYKGNKYWLQNNFVSIFILWTVFVQNLKWVKSYILATIIFLAACINRAVTCNFYHFFYTHWDLAKARPQNYLKRCVTDQLHLNFTNFIEPFSFSRWFWNHNTPYIRLNQLRKQVNYNFCEMTRKDLYNKKRFL